MTLKKTNRVFHPVPFMLAWRYLAALGVLLLGMLSGCGGGGTGQSSVPNRAASSPVVFLGDSVTEGSGVPLAFPALIARDLSITAINRGLGGNTSGDMLARLSDCFTAQPKTLVLECGLNDMGDSIASDVFTANVRAIVDACRAHHVTIVLCTIIPYHGRVGYPPNPGVIRLLSPLITSLSARSLQRSDVLSRI